MSVRRGGLQSWSFAIWLYRGKEVEKKTNLFLLKEKKKEEGEEGENILSLHAPHYVVNILLRCILFFFDSLYNSLSAAK